VPISVAGIFALIDTLLACNPGEDPDGYYNFPHKLLGLVLKSVCSLNAMKLGRLFLGAHLIVLKKN